MNFTTLVDLLPAKATLKGFHPLRVQTLIDEFNVWRESNTDDDYQIQVTLKERINRLEIRVVHADDGRMLFYGYAQGEKR